MLKVKIGEKEFEYLTSLETENTTMAQAAVRSRSIVRVTQSVWMS